MKVTGPIHAGRLTAVLLAALITLLAQGCYTFKGYSIDSSLQTFFVEQFDNAAFNAPPNINQTFSEALKLKVSRESNLKIDQREPDIVFDGAVTGYNVASVSPEPGEFAALQRLEITVMVDYTDNQNPDNNWKQQFSFFADFSPDTNLLDVQDELIAVIFNQILEDVFNKAFTNW